MQTTHLEGTEIKTLKAATATLKKAKRDYRTALARIERAEQFLAKSVEGLGYESGKWGALYGVEPFTYPPRLAVYNGGLSRVGESLNTVFFASDNTGWHFWIAPTIERDRSTTIQNDQATRLIDAPAGMVVYCAARVEADVVMILERLAAIVEASYDRVPTTPRRSNPPAKRGKNTATTRAPTKAQIN